MARAVVLYLSNVNPYTPRIAELQRIFGAGIELEINHLSPIGLTSESLSELVRDCKAVAIVLAGVNQEQRSRIQPWPANLVVLSSLSKEVIKEARYNNERYSQPRTVWVGFGMLTGDDVVKSLTDGELNYLTAD